MCVRGGCRCGVVGVVVVVGGGGGGGGAWLKYPAIQTLPVYSQDLTSISMVFVSIWLFSDSLIRYCTIITMTHWVYAFKRFFLVTQLAAECTINASYKYIYNHTHPNDVSALRLSFRITNWTLCYGNPFYGANLPNYDIMQVWFLFETCFRPWINHLTLHAGPCILGQIYSK